jgi:pimeloyl-ACP methyl ester carboxylesterase
MCHGFPELAFSWSRQIHDLADAGFRAIAADQRGYGGSDAPPDVTDYDLSHLTDDMAHLLDALEIDRAVFVDHDWGGFIAWGMPVRHPDRSLGVIGVTPQHPESELRKAGVLYESATAFRDIFATHVVIDDEQRFVTGQNQNSGHETAHEMMRLIAQQSRP